jgi:hypothetical protein
VNYSTSHFPSAVPLFVASYLFDVRLYKCKTGRIVKALTIHPWSQYGTLSRDAIPLNEKELYENVAEPEPQHF